MWVAVSGRCSVHLFHSAKTFVWWAEVPVSRLGVVKHTWFHLAIACAGCQLALQPVNGGRVCPRSQGWRVPAYRLLHRCLPQWSWAGRPRERVMGLSLCVTVCYLGWSVLGRSCWGSKAAVAALSTGPPCVRPCSVLYSCVRLEAVQSPALPGHGEAMEPYEGACFSYSVRASLVIRYAAHMSTHCAPPRPFSTCIEAVQP